MSDFSASGSAMLEERLEADIKSAMLAREAPRVMTLRTLKSVLLSAKVTGGTRGARLPDDEVIALLSKEAKKRQESADLYIQGGNTERAQAELTEKSLIEAYLPAQLSAAEVGVVVDAVMANYPTGDKSAMGKIIAEVKQQTAGAADGGLIAQLVKNKLAGA